MPLPKGCLHCKEGAKIVLVITGICDTGCFYCPISPGKKDKDVIFANERRVSNLSEILEEAEAMDALGTGITGGDPLMVMDRTVEAIKMLKDHFGRDHHIHLYTSSIDAEKARILAEAGLDEIRFHPPLREWEDFDNTELTKVISIRTLDVGIEVPAIPGHEKGLEHLILSAVDAGVDFVNINEFEFSESNWNMMEERGYVIKDELSSSISGSEEIAKNLMKRYRKYPIHFCSSTFKDGVQLRNRLLRRANNIAKDYEVITEDGTLIKGIIYTDDHEGTMRYLAEKFQVPPSLMGADPERGRVDIAPWILEEISKELQFKCYIIEEYSTSDRMEVERTPLNKR
jgi:Uncharacterized conserved protein related to pyruvate formate-lyase activating enzyme